MASDICTPGFSTVFNDLPPYDLTPDMSDEFVIFTYGTKQRDLLMKPYVNLVNMYAQQIDVIYRMKGVYKIENSENFSNLNGQEFDFDKGRFVLVVVMMVILCRRYVVWHNTDKKIILQSIYFLFISL